MSNTEVQLGWNAYENCWIAWAGRDEFFDLVFDGKRCVLRLNNLRLIQSIKLGSFDDYADAQHAAQSLLIKGLGEK